ncbi:DEKNAAC102337 [Brettanomyces naardenensis]|uniref:Histone-lysine N-methyltransferase, H3 lysine-36 specific n=1 Tax=Brettanomyces naardenensis TaxID=13370 RepID=A0A448YKE8_BRENA|nr:DEKNAAC102337 [Brettanomyces naardenensis]
MVMNISTVAGQSEDDEISSSTTPQPDGVQLFSDYPDKTMEALGTFQLLTENQYIDRLKNEYSAAGEVMTCDCVEHLVAGVNVACGPDSDCINRLTNVECVDDQCSCGLQCQNQRFQKNQFADVSIFLTEHKGYGMRADSDIPAHTFIVEYKGEVIDSQEYKLRKEQYANEGIKHFYFMMIREDEIIDATKRASLGRFCNHSCDPNAYIEKWVVNKRYRMGIFAKRGIRKGEEITFDYNVDRYGSEPQKCYCGAKNCVGYLGGKTQTEILALLPHAAREALGIKSSDEKKWIKTEKKLGIQISEENVADKVNDFVLSLDLTPLKAADLPKVSTCLLLPDNDNIVIERILERFDPNNEDYYELLRRFNRLHGLQALTSSIRTIFGSASDVKDLQDREMDALIKIVTIFDAWPELSSKNTINSCNLEGLLNEITQRAGRFEVKETVDKILLKWKDLPIIYRIPKRSDFENTTSFTMRLDDRRSRNSRPSTPLSAISLKSAEGAKPWGDIDVSALPERRKLDDVPLPDGWEWTTDPKSGEKYFYNRGKNITQWTKPEWDIISESASGNEGTPLAPAASGNAEDERKRKRERERERERERAKRLRTLEKERQVEQEAAAKLEEQRLEKLSKIISQASGQISVKVERGSHKGSGGANGSNHHHHHNHHPHRDEESADQNETGKHSKVEKQWMVLFASVVPNMLKDYESRIGRDNLKNCAREITHVLAQKELKRHVGQSTPSKLSSERKKKIQTFVTSYMDKFVAKYAIKRGDHDGSVA